MTPAEHRKAFVKGTYDRSPATLRRVGEYCLQDVRTEIAVGDAVGPLSAYERRVWELDQRINQRGLRIDIPYIHACLDIVDQASKPLIAEFAKLTGGLEPTQVKQLTAWCNANGLAIDSLAKDNLKALGIIGLAEDVGEDEDAIQPVDASGDTLPRNAGEVLEAVRRVLEIRAVLGSASIKKLHRMLACVNSDGRVRYTQQYHGAGTGRTAGRMFQPTNFPRGKIEGGHDPLQLVDALFSRNADYVRSLYGDPIAAVASGLRHALIAADGCEYNTGDFAGIEARVVMALAGQHDMCDLLATIGSGAYLDMAEAIYNIPPGAWTKDKAAIDKAKKEHIAEYTIGKNTFLGCGFGMGWPKFKDRYCPDQSDEFAQNVVETYRKVKAPKVPKLWRGLEAAALTAVQTKGSAEVYGIIYEWHPGVLACRIPDGQTMWYRNPQLCMRAMPWDETDIRPGWTHQAMKTGQWKTIHAYGGLLCENVVQKIARGFLVEAMYRLEAENFPLVLTVYDECMSEIPLARSDIGVYEQVMAEATAYSRKIKVPIAVEAWAGPRYRK